MKVASFSIGSKSYPNEDRMAIQNMGIYGCADQEVRRVSIEKKSNMGAAVAVAIIIDYELYCTWQGNVRIYVRHKGKTDLLTTDHLANTGYGRTALTRCIKGSGLRDDVPFLCHKLSGDDIVFVCTDGLYKVAEKNLGVLSADEISRKLNDPEDDASLIEISVQKQELLSS